MERTEHSRLTESAARGCVRRLVICGAIINIIGILAQAIGATFWEHGALQLAGSILALTSAGFNLGLTIAAKILQADNE